MKQYVILLKIAGVVLLTVGVIFLFIKGFYFTAILFCLAILGLAFSIYRDQQKNIQRVETMISNLYHGDLNLSFHSTGYDSRETRLMNTMNEALEAFRARLYNSVISEAETEAWQKLIRVLTHEIMNSVAPIISLSETVTERAATNGMNEKDYKVMLQAMQTIHRRSKGLLDFVENYRKLTRIPVPEMQPVSVASLFREIQTLVQMDGVGLSVSVQPETLRIQADRSMIEQVLINLLKNAVEACKGMPDAFVNMEASSVNGAIEIKVTDNGPGIMPEAMDKVFVPFYTTKAGGSGIGLSLSRQIMNRHGGSIAVSSEEGVGTQFTLRFGR